jgi:hypothetical protein
MQSAMLLDILNTAERNFIKEGNLMTTIFLGRDNTLGILPISGDHVSAQVDFIKKLSRRLGCDLSIMVTEAWTLSMKGLFKLTPQDLLALMEKGISDHPDRESCLTAAVEDTRHTWTGSARITDGEVGTMEFMELTEDMRSAGRMLGFIHKETDTPIIRLDEEPLTGDFHEQMTQALEGLFDPVAEIVVNRLESSQPPDTRN